MPKVSVIVPIYGVEKYIERCCISLFEQTLDDMEFVFVNDKTKDKSISVLNDVLSRYPNRHSQVKIISHEVNRGLPQARKTGISYATGDYVAHCDSDDWVDTALYESLYKSAIAKGADIVVCDFLVNTYTSIEVRVGTRSNDINAYLRRLLFQLDPVSMVNKLIRRQVYANDIIFPLENMGEDMATTLQLIYFCNKVVYTQGVYYHYDGTTESITRRPSKSATLERALQACRNLDLAIRFYKDSEDDDIKDGITHLKFMQRKLLMPIINYKDVYKIWAGIFPEINRDVLLKRSVAIRLIDRFKFFLTLIGVFPYVKEFMRENLK